MLVEWLFLAVPAGCLQFVILVFPDHTHLLFLMCDARPTFLKCVYAVRLEFLPGIRVMAG